MSFDASIAFNQLPELPPKEQIETIPVLRKLATASRALAELKGSGELIPNQKVLLNTIALQEARDSSEIENIVTTTDSLYKALANPETNGTDPAAKEIIRYQTALWEGYQELQQHQLITTNTFIHIVQKIRNTNTGIRTMPGTVIANQATGQVIYTPPDNQTRIQELLRDLERFINDADLYTVDPLLKLAIIHYQFEAIHPFTDGNGRTGRILNILYMLQQNLLEQPILYLSGYIIKNKSDYYANLRAVTEKSAWEPWILYMLDAVEQTSRITLAKIIAIRADIDRATELYRQQTRNTTPAKELIELVYTLPYTRVRNVVDAGIAQRETASKYLKELQAAEILTAVNAGRETLYINHRLLRLLSR